MITICCNEALNIANGDLVFYLSDDDWVDKNFFNIITKHFISNHECISAIGRVRSFYNNNRIEDYPIKNQPTYMEGKDICIDKALNINKFDQSNPGHSYVFKTDVLKYYGGFSAPLEIHQLFGVVAFGKSAFDKEAIMYWRRHQGQLNKLLNKNCYFEGDYILNLLNNNENNIISNWIKYHGKNDAKKIENYFYEIVLYSFYKTLLCQIFKGNFYKALIFYSQKKRQIQKTFNQNF